MQRLGLFTLLLFLLSSCLGNSGAIKVAFKDKKETSPMSVSSVQIINNQLIIHGTHLNEATSVSVAGNSLTESFTIESKSATAVTANALHAFSFDVSKTFNLLISSAEASATFAIDFSLCNASLNNAGFNCSITPHDNDVLSYDQATDKWIPRSLNGLSYQGVWDAANDPIPTTAAVGNYFIVSSVNAPYAVGDWIVWNGTTYDQVAMPTAVTSVFGRSGAVVAAEGDYTLNQLLDVDLTVAPVNGKVLKYNGTKWVAADDNAGGAGGAGSVSSTEIADGSITNADINASAAIDYSKLSIPAGSIPYAKLSIADGDIPVAKITGIPAVTTVLTTSISDGDTTHAPDGNVVYDTFATKLDKTGGTITTMLNVPAPVFGTEATNKDWVENLIDSYGKWVKSTNDISYTAGNVGIGAAASATATTKLKVTGDSETTGTAASTSVMTASLYVDGWSGAWAPVTIKNNQANGYSGFILTDSNNTNQAAIGFSNSGAGIMPGAAFFSSLLSTTPVTIGIGGIEAVRVAGTTGNVGIGTNDPKSKLAVSGAIVSVPPSPYTGATVNLATSNTHVLTSVGQSAITIGNMVHGGSYTLIIQDTTSRTYTFTGCASSKFQPANIATIAGTHSIYNIMTVYNGTDYDCYITWSSGYN